MLTKRETILTALADLLSTIPHVPVLRGEVLPERIPPAGLMILRDGSPGEPGMTLSPLMYHYQHRAGLEMIVQSATDRDALFDALSAQVGAVIAADRTLLGLCDWVEPEAAEPVDLPVEGAASLKAGIIPITLHYATSDALG
ncbi:acyl-CoA transferase [Thalassobacter stenotrophicus]|uniref:acyl-CoA transferase n=1 Tax=Thalassobacter stenotrophicus TaxID=266809 RepID=UPI0022A9E30C|nr:acyl-CoA transferase [Thalassobacter stenotrophicus]UYP68528.1 acyl-CoA transferase [Thalassobacter stenotrophicus]